MNTTTPHEVEVHEFREGRMRTNGYYSKYTNRYENTSAGDRTYDPSRVYINFKGETILDNLNNRVARPYTTLRPIVIAELQKLEIKFTKIRWSRHAGCRMCPCSPGFIIEGHEGKDFILTVTDKTEYPDREVTILL